MNVMQEASNVLDQLVGEIRGKFAQSRNQEGVIDSVKAFTGAVDWKVILLTLLYLKCRLYTSKAFDANEFHALCRSLGSWQS